MDKARILVIDDEPAMLENCARLLGGAGYLCHTLAEPRRFEETLLNVEPHVVLVDLRMPGVDGMKVLASCLTSDPALPVIVITAYATVASAVEAIRQGAFDYLAKPFTADQLLLAVQRAARHRQLLVENSLLREQVARESGLEGFVGSSRAIRKILDHVRKVAPSEANVLITGESGTGKELIARCIHAWSPRKACPFVPVDCAAVPEGLLESELFGHERGAFTGAVSRRNGLLAAANGGTVFLDELADLGAGLQSKLLRVLEQRQIRRLGDARLIDLDIRVVAATNADVETAVAEGRIRPDLYFRLNVVHLKLPPLRYRGDDIALLAKTFLEDFAARSNKEPPRPAPEVWDALERYPWPGNVRELKNLIQRLVVLDDDGRITIADLPEPLRLARTNPPPSPGPDTLAYEAAQADALRAFRRSYLARLLEQHGGNVTQAARTAGVSRRTLHRWLAELSEMDRERER